jgi:tRNA(adenine34) deaminase
MVNHEQFMDLALREAAKAHEQKEVPIGCVIIHNAAVVGRGYNQTERLQDPTAHAEMIAITAAATTMESRRLEDCTLYVTLEPCPMCAGAIVQARIPVVVFGAADPKAGACGTLYNIVQDTRLNHRAQVIGGIREDLCASLLTDFFSNLRRGGTA